MSRYLDTQGQPTYGIGLCARCSRKFPLARLFDDPNSPGLKVCFEDLDQYDPYRLAPPSPDNITLPFVRPDISIGTNPAGLLTQDGHYFLINEEGTGYFIA